MAHTRRLLIAMTVVLAVGVAFTVMPSRGAPGGFEMLKGRWVRPDGGYVVEIRSVDPSGKIDAVYLNPRPIHVARAHATRDGSRLKVFVELPPPTIPAARTR